MTRLRSVLALAFRVAAALSLLAGLVVPNEYVRRRNESNRLRHVNLRHISTALQAFASEHDAYPNVTSCAEMQKLVAPHVPKSWSFACDDVVYRPVVRQRDCVAGVGELSDSGARPNPDGIRVTEVLFLHPNCDESERAALDFVLISQGSQDVVFTNDQFVKTTPHLYVTARMLAASVACAGFLAAILLASAKRLDP